ncbi:hypothetical protein V8B55DRAFT_1543073 [Mucor lusitanicus]|uniref:DUF726 domain-containing protein n=2 Tax=Mucor circinelloides f. lusitanicus TaxID=29924 RepID=A0A168NJG7_MUCCL|nr:hypothetical protein FB192DRAFT_1389317 [Mucor lusitanicus]OAD06354.1 hypothetical protein MUCCIDRAFT_106925 [Mucor lusitanicus CBS 277.49]
MSKASSIANVALKKKKYFTDLPSLKVLSRPHDARSEVTVYVKGFLAEGDSPENFQDWLHSHRLLVLSPSHRWAPAALGYSWPSGSATSHIPLPLASFGSTAYLIAKNLKQLKNLRFPTPASIAGALAVDVGIHATRLAYQFSVANQESHDRAEMLAWRLLDLRRKYEYLRVVGHSLGCRHIVEACSLMNANERPDSIHLCAPALVAPDIVNQIRKETGGLGQNKTLIYYSPKDITLGILLRTLLKGDQAIGEIGLPEQVGFEKDWLDETVKSIDVSKSLGGFYVGAHTDYANKFHYFAQPY